MTCWPVRSCTALLPNRISFRVGRIAMLKRMAAAKCDARICCSLHSAQPCESIALYEPVACSLLFQPLLPTQRWLYTRRLLRRHSSHVCLDELHIQTTDVFLTCSSESHFKVACACDVAHCTSQVQRAVATHTVSCRP
jgi:hypothetical protein